VVAMMFAQMLVVPITLIMTFGCTINIITAVIKSFLLAVFIAIFTVCDYSGEADEVLSRMVFAGVCPT